MEKIRTIKVAAVQMSPVLYSRQGTVQRIIEHLDTLSAQGVQLAVFPETVIPYYPYFSYVQSPYKMARSAEILRLLDESVEIPSATTDLLADACRRFRIAAAIGVNERDGGSLYNTQLFFDVDGSLLQRRRKTIPTYHERMIWGQGDGFGLRAFNSTLGRIGQLACWEHYNPLARYALIADAEQIHIAMYPGSIFGDLFSMQTEVNTRQHALESACFVICASAWLNAEQQAQMATDTAVPADIFTGGCFTAVIAPDGTTIGTPIREGEGTVIADLDFRLIDRRKNLMDARGHYSRPGLLSLLVNREPTSVIHDLPLSATNNATGLVNSAPRFQLDDDDPGF